MLLILNTKKLSEIKKELDTLENVIPVTKRHYVPEHFHVTEVGLITKNFIDCGGKVRNETVINSNYGMLMILNTV
jgi:hypothetical protein